MPKAIWISVYKSVTDPNALVEYAKLAIPAMEGSGARILARGMPSKVYEAGVNQRTVVVEYPSVEAAIKFYESPAYQLAVKALGKGAEREVRIIEAVE